VAWIFELVEIITTLVVTLITLLIARCQCNNRNLLIHGQTAILFCVLPLLYTFVFSLTFRIFEHNDVQQLAVIGICMMLDAIVKTFMTWGNRRQCNSNQRGFANLIEKAGNHGELPPFREKARICEQ